MFAGIDVRVRVMGANRIGGHTEYDLLIGPRSGAGGSWSVSRRFRQFDALLSRLKPHLAGAAAPKLPPKKFFGRMDPDFIAQRQKGLQAFLDAVGALARGGGGGGSDADARRKRAAIDRMVAGMTGEDLTRAVAKRRALPVFVNCFMPPAKYGDASAWG